MEKDRQRSALSIVCGPRIHLLLTKPIEIAWLIKLSSVLGMALDVWPLAIITIASSLLCGVAYLLSPRVGIELGVWCGMITFLGPIGCLFLVGLLLAAFFRAGRRHVLAFALGSLFGLASFGTWCYAVNYDQAGAPPEAIAEP